MSAVIALAESMEVMTDVNIQSQITTALSLFYDMACYVPLIAAWSGKLKEDQIQYFVDSLKIPDNPSMSAQAASDYMEYSKDSAEMDTDTGKLNNMIQSGKSQVQGEGQAMDQVYNLMEGPLQLLKATLQAITIAAS